MNLRTQTQAGAAPQQLFFTTPVQRVALARQQFFEEGQRPSGLVGEAVIQSWMRCRKASANPRGAVAFEPVSVSRLHSALGRNRQLLQAAGQELASMETSLAGTECRVLLTDGEGVIVHATQNSAAAQEPILKKAARVGVNISEGVVGTTAPGIVARTGQACTVSGAEHFYEFLQFFQCAAAPIRDVHGRLAAVLDLSIESRTFGFDAASMVGLYATSIENRLLQAQSTEHLVLQFQASPSLLGTPLEALAGITADGQVAWLNSVAARLLDQQPGAPLSDTECMLGLSLADLLRQLRSSRAEAVRLPSGLGVWVKVRMAARNGADFNHGVCVSPLALAGDAQARPAAQAGQDAPPAQEAQSAEPASAAQAADATLGDHSRLLIERTLQACGGNISKAARTLGVSRGMLYRRLQRWGQAPSATS
ncbi:MAG TPA: helix-turn-helix domain-containing protein [Burkholderiaceae bacterium]|nr:helix-turn-helix domain-containing protein [Burkholderiaceae bacterium]